jgi:hypothetical protein
MLFSFPSASSPLVEAGDPYSDGSPLVWIEGQQGMINPSFIIYHHHAHGSLETGIISRSETLSEGTHGPLTAAPAVLPPAALSAERPGSLSAPVTGPESIEALPRKATAAQIGM